MEVFEQLRLLLLLIMAFLSYRYVDSQPLSLPSSQDSQNQEEEIENCSEEKIIEEIENEGETIKENEPESIVYPDLDGVVKDDQASPLEKQVNTSPTIEGELIEGESESIQQENQDSVVVLNDVENEEENVSVDLKKLKTKHIRRQWRRAPKVTAPVSQIHQNIVAQVIE